MLRKIIPIILIPVCVYLIGGKAIAATGNQNDPITDDYELFPVMFECPPEDSEDYLLHYQGNCEPGTWYFGSLLSDSNFDDYIGVHSASIKWKTKYESKSQLLITTEELLGQQIELYKQNIENLNSELIKSNSKLQNNSGLTFGLGVVIGVVVVILITAIVYKTRLDIESVEVSTSGMNYRLAW